MKKCVLSFYQKLINYNNKIILSLLVYFCFISVGYFVLNFHDFFLDTEAPDFGNMAIGVLDGITKGISFGEIQSLEREGSEFFLFPFILIFFQFFGESYYVLQKTALFLYGFFAAIWFLVACEFFNKKRFLIAVIFIIATPLIHLQISLITNIATHMGASAIFGLSLLFLIKASKEESNIVRMILLFLSGIFYFSSFFYGYISLLLLPLIIIFFLKSTLKLRALVIWLLGFLMLLPFAYKGIDFSFFEMIKVSRINLDGLTTIEIFFMLLVYFGGVLQYSFFKYSYSLLSIFYIIILLILALFFCYCIFYKKQKNKIYLIFRELSVEFYAFFIGTLLFIFSIAYFKYTLTFSAFDGLRYLIPIVPFYLFAICYFFVNYWSYPFIKFCFLLYFLFTLFIIISFIYPFYNTNKDDYSQIRGFNLEYIIKNPNIIKKINLSNVNEKRLNNYLFVMGYTYGQFSMDIDNDFMKTLKEQMGDKDDNVKNKALNEFVSGYSFSKDNDWEKCGIEDSDILFLHMKSNFSFFDDSPNIRNICFLLK